MILGNYNSNSMQFIIGLFKESSLNPRKVEETENKG